MDSRSQLDYALFQLTPTRTRCDLVICAGDCKEKLASGLLEPFIAHLKFAKDQIAKGGYSITLSASASWFTKSTLQRFVKFVSTPEILERFTTIEREIDNIDCSLNTNTSSDSQTVYEFEEHTNKSATHAYKHEGNASDAIHEEDSKVHLQRVLETRKAVLQKEQAMVYARALVAGFERDSLEDLIYFADAFGSPRLREACLDFIRLWNTKSNDRVWMDEVAAMQASSHSQYSYMGTSGGMVVPGEDDPNQELRINVKNGEFSNKKQNGAVDGMASDSSISRYMYTHQSGPMFQPTYQGYPFQGMVAPLYYQGHLPWSPNVDDFRSRGKRSKRKGSRELKQDRYTDSSDLSSGSDSGSYRRNSSQKVVIRNINYITSTRNGEAEWVSNDDSSLGAVNQDLDRTVEDEPESHKETQQWDIFQSLLMQDADDKMPEEVTKPHTSEPFIMVENHLFDEDNNHIRSSKSREDPSPVRKKYVTFEEEFVSPKFEEPFIIPSGTIPEFSTKSSTIGRHGEGDWFLGSTPDIAKQETSRDIFEDHFKYVESTKDVLVDDPVVVHARPVTESSDAQLRTQDVLMVSESNLTQKALDFPRKNVEAECVNEPSDLYIVLDRDTAGHQAMAAWTPEMELGNGNDKIIKLDSAEDKKLRLQDKETKPRPKALVGKGREKKGSTIEAKSKALVGKSKSDIISRSKKSTQTNTTILKGKSEKEEEKRKKMEESLVQRQKRIAERSGSSDKPKVQVAPRELKKSNKPVIRSSTIDRLSTARVVTPKVLPTESKPGDKHTIVTTKANGESKPAKKPTVATTKENIGDPRSNPSTKVKGEPKHKHGKKLMKAITKESIGGKIPTKPTTKENTGESKLGKKPPKATTKENIGESKPPKASTKDNIGESKLGKKPTETTIRVNGRTAGAEKKEAKPERVEHIASMGLPRTSPLNGVGEINCQSAQSDGGSETLHKASSVPQEDTAKKALHSVSFIINAKENPNHPPPDKGSPERYGSISRKKVQTSTKALSSLRKLLSFGKRM